VWFPGAKKDGLLYRFASTAHRRIVRVVLGLLLVLCVLVAVGIQPVTGSVMILAAVGVWIYYYFMSRKQFGGITGDLAGYFLCLCELVCVLVVGFL
jgi:adenosylcobinamide-GDP ribazoletransferase